jgi:L-threonylcarbamoyladenylate synthase
MSLIVKLDPDKPDDDTLGKVISSITAGKTIAFPTETYYALGVSAYSEAAIKKVYAIKGREQGKPLPLIIEGASMLKEVTAEIPEIAHSLIQEFWPGGLTLIFKASPKVPSILTADTSTIAVRNSSHALASLLVASAQVPLTSTSANLSGNESCSSAAEVEKQLGGLIDIIIDGGTTEGLMPSTMLDLTKTPPQMIREGIIPSERLQQFIG